ncbi:MAG: hypothetical protein SFY70_01465 [Bacteroidia bacterium]|nr:hypothetical protein [Bacteroidia bacterium]
MDVEVIYLESIDHLTSRASVRQFLLEKWASEAPAIRYKYFVEELLNGKSIYLERPTGLNKGCDFRVVLEDEFLNNRTKAPKHSDIFNELSAKKGIYTKEEFVRVVELLHKVYRVEPCRELVSGFASTVSQKEVGIPIDGLLLLSKWLFIEQDLTYWGHSGRKLLFDSLSALF